MYIQLMKSLGLIRKPRKRFQALHWSRKVKLIFPQSLSGHFKGLTTNHQLRGRRKQSPKSHLSCNFFPCSGVFILKLLVFRLISTLYLPTIPTNMRPCFYGDRETVENIKKQLHHPINVLETIKNVLETRSQVTSQSREGFVLTNQCPLRHLSKCLTLALKSH